MTQEVSICQTVCFWILYTAMKLSNQLKSISIGLNKMACYMTQHDKQMDNYLFWKLNQRKLTLCSYYIKLWMNNVIYTAPRVGTQSWYTMGVRQPHRHETLQESGSLVGMHTYTWHTVGVRKCHGPCIYARYTVEVRQPCGHACKHGTLWVSGNHLIWAEFDSTKIMLLSPGKIFNIGKFLV